MKADLSALSGETVQQIALLIETLDRSGLDFLQLDIGDMQLTIGKGSAPTTVGPTVSPETPPPQQILEPKKGGAVSLPASSAPAHSSVERNATPPANDTIEIKAPVSGIFYGKSKPDSPPFVTVGTVVDDDTTVCLIEIMKLFNAVPAGAAGVITEICVQDAEFIQFGQTLFRLQPTTPES